MGASKGVKRQMCLALLWSFLQTEEVDRRYKLLSVAFATETPFQIPSPPCQNEPRDAETPIMTNAQHCLPKYYENMALSQALSNLLCQIRNGSRGLASFIARLGGLVSNT